MKAPRVAAALAIALAVALFTVLQGLSAAPVVAADDLPPAEVEALEKRVSARWAAKAAWDFEQVWEYSTPSFRAAFPKALYVQKFSHGVEWELTGVEITHYDRDAAVASVTARVMTRSMRPTTTASIEMGDQDVVIREKWIKSRGEWWHVANY